MTDRIESRVFNWEAFQEEERRRYSLDPKDPEHPTGFVVEDDHICVFWGGYEYPIARSDFQTPFSILKWLHHLGKKQWAGMTPPRVSRFITTISRIKDWDLYTGAPPRRETSNDAERAKLTPDLRYRVLKRDGYRCRACGSGPEQGAILQIDHIKAIANGGLTEYSNLQALCSMCNLGKRDG